MQKQKIIFIFLSAFLFFPMLVPAATIIAIPVPNIIVLLFSIFDLDLGSYFFTLAKMYKYNVPSYFISLIIFFGISHFLYYEKNN